MGNLPTMAAPTTNTKHRTVHCSKHAFAPIASFRPKNAVAPNVTLPVQRHQSGLGRAGLASESPFTGDDPVNGTDPLGLFCLGLCTFTNAAKDVGHAAGDVGHFVVTHPKVAIGIGLGVLAVATGGLGLAAAAGVEGITISATTLGVASVVAGGGAAALDYSGCFDTNGDGLSRTLACTGFATGLLGAGFGALAVALPESVFALQLGSVGLGFGIGANGLDIWNAIEGNQSSSSASACRTSK